MKNVLLFLLIFSTIYAQQSQPGFDPDSYYLERGSLQLKFFNTDKSDIIDQSYHPYKTIEARTVAVDPAKILPGSVVYIPQTVGIKLNDGTYHDGYFLAHRVLKKGSKSEIAIFTDTKQNAFKDISAQKIDVYAVRGVMAKTMQTKFYLKFRTSKEKQTYQMVASDFTDLMHQGNKDYPEISKRIQYYSQRGLGTPYLIFNLGEGASSNPDPDPTIDFSRTDCMTFCEHTLALAISDNYKDMYNNLQKIRYKNGDIRYVMRNHYTIADWLPNNNWLLKDVTKEIGGDLTNKMTKTIDRPNFYKTNGVPENELADAPGKEDVTADYIPTENLLKVKDKLQGGEIVSIVTTHPAVISAHMGIIIRDQWNNLIFRHASSPDKTNQVMDERFEDYVSNLKDSKTRVGMLFMRARDNYKIP
ncbi:MAG: DUF1460 domain-containing protein [Calditrichae bacterium]|nr:DUF1460 domain-containing protein [Calditrichia bacterium]